MKLTTVLSCVNDNKEFYMFIPRQIRFWSHFNIRFIAVFVGTKIPEELISYSENIILWSKNLNVDTKFVGQNLRLYYPALIKLPEDEMVMITDMDMFPTSDTYYKSGLESMKKADFINYRNIDGNRLYICYNSAHPETWATIFGIHSEHDIEKRIQETHELSTGWFNDQEVLYEKTNKYPHLKILNKPIKRLEVADYKKRLTNKETNFVKEYDAVHFHRSYTSNLNLILDAENQIIRKKYFITFGGCGQNYIDAANRLLGQANSTKLFDKTIAYTDNSLKDTEFWKKHSEFIRKNKRGCGYWIWKPYIIKKTIEEMQDGDILLYLDCGCELNIKKKEKIRQSFDLARKDILVGTLACGGNCLQKDWTKMDLFEKMKMTDKKYLNSPQRQGGIIMIFINSTTRKFVNEWLDLQQEYHLIDDSPSIKVNVKTFKEHRHDQSIFSLLTMKYNLFSKTHLDPVIEIVRNRRGKSILKAGSRRRKRRTRRISR